MEEVLENVADISMYQGKSKGKSIPHRPVTGPEDYWKLRLPNFMRIGNMKVVRLLALSTGRLYQQIFLVLISVTGRVYSRAIERPKGLCR
jgi:hypothetical protein